MGNKPVTDFQPILDIDSVDLSAHALVEASAGTGKTYTIEHLVVRLLKESPELNLENILLVTFTEKATSELKLRIRQKIEQTLDGEPLADGVQKKLGDTLDNFDNAAIYTIHGFCHTLLKEFPFETGNLFHQEVIDDGSLLEKLIRGQMRTDWPQRYGHRLEELLVLSDFSGSDEGFVETAVNLAQRLSGDPVRETLIPNIDGMDTDALWQEAQQAVVALKALVGPPPLFSKGYGQLNIHARSRAAIIRDMVEPVEQALDQVNPESCRLSGLRSVIRTLSARHSSGVLNIDRLIPQKWLKAGENLHVCSNLVTIKHQLQDLVQLFVRLSHVLMLETVRQLKTDARVTKQRNGWISYQDMLTQVADFLTGDEAAEGIGKIRHRYQVAFVDEFQDTDDLQWRIFNTLFMDPQHDGSINRLFLIGDPKQAIYGFRGADVFTYLGARQQMKILADKGQANLYDLTVNWRSAPGLVDIFNRLFAQDSWFGNRSKEGPFEIGYTPADSPDPNQLPAIITCDRSERPPFNVMDLTSAKTHLTAKALLSGFICSEIRHLVGKGRIRIAGNNGLERALHYGDIAILVRSKSEFAQIEPFLNEASIPYTYYRKPGLFQCPESHWLSMVLHAVCNPEQIAAVKLALLTPFFDIQPESLEKSQELPTDHAFRQLLIRWYADAKKRRWGQLFQSLMEDSGLIFRHGMDPGWERTETNLQQLFDYLEVMAYEKNMDIGGLVALLDSLRLTAAVIGTDEDIHQIEDEGNKVQILTMHVSKGLEFPVVFIAGGLTGRNNSGIHVYHEFDTRHPEAGCRKVVDLTATTGGEKAKKEKEDEDKRLYYVALTRACFKLYIPYYPYDRKYNWIGPICRFVSQSIRQVLLEAEDGNRCGAWHEITEYDKKAPFPSRYSNGERRGAIGSPKEQRLPISSDFRSRKVSLESFSSISHRIHQSHDQSGILASFTLVDPAPWKNDEPDLNLDLEPAITDQPVELPGGTQMGSMFHHIFENINFQAVVEGPADILDVESTHLVIDSAIELYRIGPQWKPQIARIVSATLNTPIESSGKRLILGHLSPVQRRHEMEFYFPLIEPFPAGVQVPGCTTSGDFCKEMFIRGFIDLVFLWQDRYYIADWKSNRLEEGYHQTVMAQEMETAGYELQYQLYTLATLRWLKHQIGDGFDPYRHFGGAYYFFIRGMETGGQNGIFHVTPEQLLPHQALQETIQKQIAGLNW